MAEAEEAPRDTLLETGIDQTEFVLASKSFSYFLDFVKVVEPPQFQSGFVGGPTPFVKWPHLAEMAEALPETRLMVVGKARQNGFSWLVSAYAAWLLRFHKHSFVPMISQGQVEAGDLLAKVRSVLDNLPESWRVEYEPDSTLEIGVKGMESHARALASTEKAGRSLTATCVIIDEAEFQEYLPLTFAAIKPTIDASSTGGGQIIMGSTINKAKQGSIFKQYLRGAPSNGWVKRVWGWKLRPGRDQEWWDRTYREASEDEALGMTPELYMQQEYPGDEAEMLAPASAISAFDMDAMTQMEKYIKEPIVRDEAINVYHQWTIGHRYVAASDVGNGVGGDYSVTVVVDARNGWVVADVYSNILEPDEFTDASLKMLEMYRNPEWGIEDAGPGHTVITLAQQMRYPRLFQRKSNPRSMVRVPGWRTDVLTREPMWAGLISAVRNGLVTVPSKMGLAQFRSCIRNAKKHDRVEAQYGAHDDYPTAVAIAFQIIGTESAFSGKLITVGSRFGVI
jgi:hypothetical protein